MARPERAARLEGLEVERMAGVPAPDAPAYQAYRILYWGFIALPIVAGADKFTQLLARWDLYLAPQFPQLLGIAPELAMRGVGVIEMVAGLIVAMKPSVGGWIVGLWLWAIVINLLMLGQFYDIALRDFGLSLGAFALARMARTVERRVVE